MTQYSRENPSPRYLEMQEMYKTMHNEGDATSGLEAGKTFTGQSLMEHVGPLQGIFRGQKIKSVLDYGCGKAMVHQMAEQTMQDGMKLTGTKALWDLDELALYDPGHGPYSTFPNRTFEAVICTDVLEHIPEDDLPWLLDEIFGFAERFVFLTVALYPAGKSLPNGENAHITQKSAGWWADLIETVALNHPTKAYLVPLCYAWKGGRRVILNGVPG